MTGYIDQLVEAGYKEYTQDSNYLGKSTNVMYQKVVSDSAGKRFFINVFFYRLRPGMGESVQAEVQYNSHEDGDTFDVVSFKKDVSAFEGFFNNIWEVLGCDYYEKLGE